MSALFSGFAGIVNVWNGMLYRLISPKGTSSKLLRLPPELILQIVKSLEWKDILHLRQVSRYLAGVTKTREIWLHLVNESISTNPLPPKLERPIATYSSLELERLFLLWRSAKYGLAEKSFPPARERSFSCVNAKLVHLVKGGRWALVATQTGAVTYYDLNEKTIYGRQLIPDQMGLVDHSKVFMVADYDMQSPFLEFTLAFSLHDFQRTMAPNDIPQHRHMVHIWRVCAVLNSSQRVVGLTGTRMASFPHHREIRGVHSLSLLGPNLAFNAMVPSDIHAVVVDWEKANDDPLNYPCRMVEWSSFHAFTYLLPGERILLISEREYSFHDLSLAPETTTFEVPPEYEFPSIWHVDGPRRSNASDCFLTGKTANIIVRGIETLSIYTFDYSSHSPPTVTDIAYCNLNLDTLLFYYSTFIGSRNTVTLHYTCEATVFSYFPLSTPHQLAVSCQKGRLSKACDERHPVVDEQTGRVVCSVYHKETNNSIITELAVVDYARISCQ